MDSLLSPADVARLFQIESGGNASARTGSNRGLGQFGPREEAQYGITNDNYTNPAVQAAAVAAEAANNRARLRTVLGREPTGADYYLAHQQGAAGAPALFSNPTMPAWQAIRPFYKSDAIAKQAITGNIPRGSPLYGRDADSITSADFTNYWTGKFNQAPGSAAPATNAVASLQPAAQPPTAGPAPAPSAPPAAPAGIAGLLGGAGPAMQKTGNSLVASAAQGPQPFQFQPSGLPALLPTGPLHPLPLQLPKLV